jgi:Zn-dependent protease
MVDILKGGKDAVPLAMVTTLFVFASVVIHELGHIAAALKRGIQIGSITLYVFGGIEEYSSEIVSPESEFWVSMSGAMTSLMIGVGLSFLNNPIAHFLSEINIAIGVINLVPVFPLDGGRLLRDVLWRFKYPFSEATARASKYSSLLAAAIMIFGLLLVFAKGIAMGSGMMVLGGILMTAGSHYQKEMDALRRAKSTVKDIMVPRHRIVMVPPDITIREFLSQHFFLSGVHAFPVKDNGQIIGLLTYWWVRSKLITLDINENMSVREVMKPIDLSAGGEHVIGADAGIAKTLDESEKRGVDRFFVMEGGKCVGFLTKSLLLKQF